MRAKREFPHEADSRKSCVEAGAVAMLRRGVGKRPAGQTASGPLEASPRPSKLPRPAKRAAPLALGAGTAS